MSPLASEVVPGIPPWRIVFAGPPARARADLACPREWCTECPRGACICRPCVCPVCTAVTSKARSSETTLRRLQDVPPAERLFDPEPVSLVRTPR